MVLLATSTYPLLLGFAGMLTAPESPVWLASKGRSAEAESAARHLWGPAAAAQLDTTAVGGSSKAASVGPRSQHAGSRGLFCHAAMRCQAYDCCFVSWPCCWRWMSTMCF